MGDEEKTCTNCKKGLGNKNYPKTKPEERATWYQARGSLHADAALTRKMLDTALARKMQEEDDAAYAKSLAAGTPGGLDSPSAELRRAIAMSLKGSRSEEYSTPWSRISVTQVDGKWAFKDRKTGEFLDDIGPLEWLSITQWDNDNNHVAFCHPEVGWIRYDNLKGYWITQKQDSKGN